MIKRSQKTRLDTVIRNTDYDRGVRTHQPDLFGNYEELPQSKEYTEKKQKESIDINLPEVEEHHLKELPPDVVQTKQDLLNAYNNLRTVSKLFMEKYKEANEFASCKNTINLRNINYKEFFILYSKFLELEIKRAVGYWFGSEVKINQYIGYFLKNKDKRINIFNVRSQHSNNIHFISHFNMLSNNMQEIIDDYEKRKKLLKNVDKISKEVAVELNNEYFTNLFKFLDEHFPDYKQQFLDEIGEQINMHGVWASELSVDNLKKFKSYKSIYEKAIEHSTHSLSKKIKNLSLQEVERQLKEYIEKLAKQKQNVLLHHLNDQDFQLLKIEYNIDLKSILLFFKNRARNSSIKTVDEYFQKIKEGKITGSLFTGFFEIFNEYKNNYENISRMKSQKDANEYLEKERKLFINNSLFPAIDDDISNVFKDFVSKLTRKISSDNLISIDTNAVINTIFRDIIRPIPSDAPRILEITAPQINEYLKKLISMSIINNFDLLTTGKIGFLPARKEDKEYNFLVSCSGLTNFIIDYGKITPDNIVKSIQSKLGSDLIPIEFLNALVKYYINNKYNFSKLLEIDNNDIVNFKTYVSLLKKFGKFDINNFVNYFDESYNQINDIIQNIKRFSSDINEKFFIDNIPNMIKNIDNIDTGLIRDFLTFLHNRAESLDTKYILNILQNPNFFNFSEFDIAKKIISCYVLVMAYGGPEKFINGHKDIINMLKEKEYLTSDFEKNLNFVVDLIGTNKAVNPKSSSLSEVRSIMLKLDTAIQMVEDSDAILELSKVAKPKDINLFKLDYQLSPTLRFRVLRDNDPRILRVGAETNCCQRVGKDAAGVIAARDSFINNLASVAILEWLDDGEWKILSQSYFHYVPRDKSYILDNVEYNYSNVSDSEINLEDAYALWANHITNTIPDIKYFLAGKGYSKLKTKSFATKNIHNDPRSFDNDSLLPNKKDFYTDFSPKDAIDLNKPKISIERIKQRFFKEKKKEASYNKSFRKLAFVLSYCDLI